MTDNLTHRKYELIQQIILIQSETSLNKLEQEVEMLKQRESQLWTSIVKPSKPKLSLEEMIIKQSYTPPTQNAFFSLADEIGIEEPLEDLLKMLD